MPKPVSSFQQKFDVRCRRLLGVTDDTKPVKIETNGPNSSFTGCDTCGYGSAEAIEIMCDGKHAQYWSLPMLLEDLGEVKL
jgi:hypothetical protein